jgi:hypothetical protein
MFPTTKFKMLSKPLPRVVVPIPTPASTLTFKDQKSHTLPKRKNVLENIPNPSMSAFSTIDFKDKLPISLMKVQEANVIPHSQDLSKSHLVPVHLSVDQAQDLSGVQAVDHLSVVQAVDHLSVAQAQVHSVVHPVDSALETPAHPSVDLPVDSLAVDHQDHPSVETLDSALVALLVDSLADHLVHPSVEALDSDLETLAPPSVVHLDLPADSLADHLAHLSVETLDSALETPAHLSADLLVDSPVVDHLVHPSVETLDSALVAHPVDSLAVDHSVVHLVHPALSVAHLVSALVTPAHLSADLPADSRADHLVLLLAVALVSALEIPVHPSVDLLVDSPAVDHQDHPSAETLDSAQVAHLVDSQAVDHLDSVDLLDHLSVAHPVEVADLSVESQLLSTAPTTTSTIKPKTTIWNNKYASSSYFSPF